MALREGARIGPRVLLVAAVVPTAVFALLLGRVGPVTSRGPDVIEVPWAETLGLRFDLRLDALGLVLALIVTGVGALVMAYARWYFADRREGLVRTALVLLLFVAAMLGIALADNLLAIYVAWELTTVCSFLLIADDGRSAASRRAALRAFVTTTGAGLAMLLGFLLLGESAGTFRISELVARPSTGDLAPVAVVLVLVGAFAKSAQVPFHPWLVEAMIAPTPATAYLHAAAMVKAGVVLLARLAPGFSEVTPWQPLVVVIGLATMLIGGWRALAQNDLKRLLAFGTIAQLGFLTLLLGAGTRTAALAGAAMLVAHALFKSGLFLVVGIIDRSAGSRDLTELSGVGRRSPLLAASALLAAASMVGLPPFVGYLGKEAALEAFHTHAWGGDVVLGGIVLGSVLTVAYTGRFLHGAFAGAARDADRWVAPRPGFLAAPMALALAGAVVGLVPHRLDRVLGAYADGLWGTGPTYHLALWHGFTPVLALSVGTLVAGAALAVLHGHLHGLHGRVSGPVTALAAQDLLVRGATVLAGWADASMHVRGLPAQLARNLLVVTLVLAAALLPVGISTPRLWDSPWQGLAAVGALAAALAVVGLRGHLQAAILLGVVGYLVAVVFVLHGAPDLALVQLLVETLTFVVFVLVLRRSPRAAPSPTKGERARRAVVATAFGAVMAAGTLAMAGRHAPSLSTGEYLRSSPGHGGPNVVNVIITEYRALDSLGEVSVLVVAATAVAGLVLRHTRTGGPPRPEDPIDPGEGVDARG